MRRSAVLGVMAMVVAGVAGTSVQTGAAATETPPETAPAAVLGENVNGDEAIAALGSELPEVAASIGMTASEFRTELSEDSDLWIDKTGAPMYVDAELAEYPDAEAGPGLEFVAPYDLADTFSLHSNEDASKVIYLDFTGHEVSGTAWNTAYNPSAFTAAPFSIDGTPESFSDLEKETIQSVWQRIAEDFAPFDIDVTTEEPAQADITRTDASDTAYGTRLVITDTDTIVDECGCGGIAYVGVFDSAGSHATYQPAFVFTRNNKSAKFIAEAGSHEVGHNLGLSHDGTKTVGYYQGHANWGPLMGVGYYHPVSQWSKGEYKGANNKQDDFTVIAAHGGALRTDDHGDKKEVATFLGATFPIEATGVITHRKDIDLLKFNAGAGELTVTVSPAPNSPNLDIALQLMTSKGKVIAKAGDKSTQVSSDVAAGMDATLTTTVAAGTYIVKIDGVSNGSGSTGYSDYGSVGAWNVEIEGSSGSGLTNIVPVAKIAGPKIVGVPGPITLSDTGSVDADGEIASTSWKFGDGTADGTGRSVSHTYEEVGTYEVEMTVTDNSGGTAVKTTKIKAVPAVKVGSISAAQSTVRGKVVPVATVTIVDAEDVPVVGASVSVSFTYGTKKSNKSGKTGADGTVVLTGPAAGAGVAVTATVTKATAKGKAFNAEAATSAASITL